MLGTRKADVLVGLHDRRLMPIEAKVSNSFTNSIKRLNNDAAVKAGKMAGLPVMVDFGYVGGERTLDTQSQVQAWTGLGWLAYGQNRYEAAVTACGLNESVMERV